MAYSLDLRTRIVAAVKAGATQPAVAERFAVSLTSVERFVRLARTGELKAKSPPGRTATIPASAYEALAQQVAEHNDALLKEHCELWREQQGMPISVYTMCRTLQRAKLTRKKRP